MTIYPKLILDALATVRYPGTGKNLVEAGMVEDNIPTVDIGNSDGASQQRDCPGFTPDSLLIRIEE